MSQECVWDITVTNWWAVTRPVTDQWSVNVMSLFTEKLPLFNIDCVLILSIDKATFHKKRFTKK